MTRTEHREETRASIDTYRRLFESLSDAAFLADVETGLIVDINRQAMALLRKRRGEIIARHYSELHPAHKADEYRQRFARHVEKGHAADYDGEVVTKDGAVVPVRISAATLTIGGQRFMLGLLRDITEQRRTEESLRESEEKYRSLVEDTHAGIVSIDLEGRFTFVNNALCQMTGYSEEEMLGKSFGAFLHQDDRERVMRLFQEGVTSPKGVIYLEFKVVHRQGHTVNMYASPAFIKYGEEIVGFSSIINDVTEQKQAEEALRESEEKLRRMFESVTDGVTVTDLRAVITDANERTARMHGFGSKGDIIGRSAFELIARHDHERAKVNMQRTLSKGAVQSIEYTLVRADGSQFPGELSASVLRNASGSPIGFIAITRDITERNRLRENMQFYIRQVVRAQEEERKRIARELHDDTAQSLAALSVEIQSIGSGGQRLAPETIQRLEQLRASTNSILESVRRFSHELRPEVLDQLGLTPALELLTHELSKGGQVDARVEVIGLERRLSPEAEVTLFRIAQEAVSNVRKHSLAKQAVVTVEFTPAKVTLSVSDNGRGFELPEVLSEFAVKGKLGLIGMRERARLVEGDFTVKSAAGKGTSVMVDIVA